MSLRRIRVLEDASAGVPVSETAQREGVDERTIFNDRRFLVKETGEIDYKAYRQHLFDQHSEGFNKAIGRGLRKTDAAWGNVFQTATGLRVDKTELSGGFNVTQEQLDAKAAANISGSIKNVKRGSK